MRTTASSLGLLGIARHVTCTSTPREPFLGRGLWELRFFWSGSNPAIKEDKQGHPFVGPAGRVLDAALEAASIARDQVYVTNIVKHFKWEPRGKRRMHSKPNAIEIEACNGWLQAEIDLVQPQII